MGDKTKIEWCDATWNPVTGCTKISPACDHCYAERDVQRLVKMNCKKYANGFTPTFHPDALDIPSQWKRPRRIFVCSMGDLFHPDIADWQIFAVWQAMAKAGQHIFYVLTKRPDRMRQWFEKLADTGPEGVGPVMWRKGWDGKQDAHCGRDLAAGQIEAVVKSGRGTMFHQWIESWGKPPAGAAAPTYDWMEGPRWWPTVLPNLWLGVTAENQEMADHRLPFLLDTPAARRFVSVEPMLGPVNLIRIDVLRPLRDKASPERRDLMPYARINALSDADGINENLEIQTGERLGLLDWVICGGESGPEARPMHPDWVRTLRNQCAVARVPFFFKQWGEWFPIHGTGRPTGNEEREIKPFCWVDPDGKTGPSGCEPSALMLRLGKKAAGRMLDGKVWAEDPGR